MKIKKAIITAAGFGTRFFPVSKSIQKEMLPLLNKPIIDYVVDDCLRAGIEEIIFVVNDTNDQIRHYYSEDKKIYNHLKFLNKLKKYEKSEGLHTKAKFSYIIQQAEGIYGTAVPVMLSYDHVKDEEAFLVQQFNCRKSDRKEKTRRCFVWSLSPVRNSNCLPIHLL